MINAKNITSRHKHNSNSNDKNRFGFLLNQLFDIKKILQI